MVHRDNWIVISEGERNGMISNEWMRHRDLSLFPSFFLSTTSTTLLYLSSLNYYLPNLSIITSPNPCQQTSDLRLPAASNISLLGLSGTIHDSPVGTCTVDLHTYVP